MCTHRTAFGHRRRGHTSSWHGGCWHASEWGVLTILASATRSNKCFLWNGHAYGSYFGFSRRHLRSSRFPALMTRLSICQPPEPFLLTQKTATLPAASDRFLNLLDMSLLGHRGSSWRNKPLARFHFQDSISIVCLRNFFGCVPGCYGEACWSSHGQRPGPSRYILEPRIAHRAYPVPLQAMGDEPPREWKEKRNYHAHTLNVISIRKGTPIDI